MEPAFNVLSKLADHPDLPVISGGARTYPNDSTPQYLAFVSKRLTTVVTAAQTLGTSDLVYKANSQDAELDEKLKVNAKYFRCYEDLTCLKKEVRYSRELCKEDVDEMVGAVDQALFLLERKREAEFEVKTARLMSQELHVIITGMLPLHPLAVSWGPLSASRSIRALQSWKTSIASCHYSDHSPCCRCISSILFGDAPAVKLPPLYHSPHSIHLLLRK